MDGKDGAQAHAALRVLVSHARAGSVHRRRRTSSAATSLGGRARRAGGRAIAIGGRATLGARGHRAKRARGRLRHLGAAVGNHEEARVAWRELGASEGAGATAT